MNKLAFVFNQLLAIRAQIDATLSLFEELPEEEQPCRHPPDERIDFSTMGRERWECGVCGYNHDPEKGVNS